MLRFLKSLLGLGKRSASQPDWRALLGERQSIELPPFDTLDARVLEALLLRICDRQDAERVDGEVVVRGKSEGVLSLETSRIAAYLAQPGVTVRFLRNRGSRVYGDSCIATDAEEVYVAETGHSNYMFIRVRPTD